MRYLTPLRVNELFSEQPMVRLLGFPCYWVVCMGDKREPTPRSIIFQTFMPDSEWPAQGIEEESRGLFSKTSQLSW